MLCTLQWLFCQKTKKTQLHTITNKSTYTHRHMHTHTHTHTHTHVQTHTHTRTHTHRHTNTHTHKRTHPTPTNYKNLTETVTSVMHVFTYGAHDLEDAGVTTPLHLHFLMAVVDTEHLGPGGPGVAGFTGRRRSGQDLKRCDRLGPLQV